MKLLIYSSLLLFLNYSSLLYGQTVKIDSLKNAIKTTKPEDQARLYNLIAWNLRNNQVDQSMEYANKALALSKKYNDSKRTAFALNTLGILYTFQNNSKKAMDCFNTAIDISIELNLEKRMADCYVNIGNIHYRNTTYDSALNSYVKAEKIYSTLESTNSLTISLANTQNNIGLVYFEQGNFTNALDYYFLSLKTYSSSNYKREISAVLNNIGDIYFQLHDFKNALKYYNESMKISTLFNDKRRFCTSLLMAGKASVAIKNYTYAFLLFDESIKISRLIKDLSVESEARIAKASALIDINDTDSAIKILLNNHSQIDSLKNDLIKAELLFTIAKTYLVNKNYTKADSHLKQSLSFATSAESASLIAKINRSLYQSSLYQGNFQEAEKYVNTYLAYHDSLFNENIIQVINTQQKYEQEKSNKELVYYKYENANLENIKNTNQTWLMGISTLLIGVIAFVVLWYFYHLSEKKSMVLLRQVQEEMHQQKIINLVKNHEMDYIKARIEGEEKERVRLSKDLHDGIGGSLGSIRLELTNNVNFPTDEKIKNIVKMVDSAYEEVRSVSRHLTPVIIRNNSFTQLIQDYIQDLAKKTQIKANIICFPQEKINQLEDSFKTEIYRISQELMTNTIKHAKAKEITYQLIIHDNYINLLFEDNGKGFKSNAIKKGIGLINIKSRIKLLRGSIEIDTRPQKGTLVNIDIPHI